MRKIFLILAFTMLFPITGAYATWRYASVMADPKDSNSSISLNEFFYPPEMVYITNAEKTSGSGTYANVNYHENVLESTITVPKGTELTFHITVFNNTNVEQGFDSVVMSGIGNENSGYDNEKITFALTNLKRPYTMDGVLADDITRIPAQQSHEFDITFTFAEGVTDFSNATLNSTLHFIFKPFGDIDLDHFTSPVDGAMEQMKKILNEETSYDILKEIMDQSSGSGAYVGNVVGSSGNDTKVLAELFEGNLNLMLTDPETNQLVKTNLTCMIKEEDLDGDNKPEITIYMTPDDLSKVGYLSTIQNVYAGVFTRVTDEDGNEKWEQLGDLYHGTARCNDYDSNLFNGVDKSINTDRWRSSQVYHGMNANSTIENVIAAYKNSLT